MSANLKIRQKSNLQLFFNRQKSIFSVGSCVIHTMFQKLKIIKSVEMPYYYVQHYFLKVLTTLKIRQKSNLQLFFNRKKHLQRVSMCYPYHVSEAKNL